MTVTVEKQGAVLVVAINRPEIRNAVDAPTADLLLKAFEDFDADDSLRVAVLTGHGDSFCAGADLKSLGDPEKVMQLDPRGHGPMGPSRLSLGKPVIAAIEGPAVAGGLELALWCDLRVAADNAFFGVYCRRWGVPLIDGGTIRLPRLIGHSRAMDMILTGRKVEAAEALSFGLANRLCAPGKALETAIILAEGIAQFPQGCMKADRSSAIRQWDTDLVQAIENEAIGGNAIIQSEPCRALLVLPAAKDAMEIFPIYRVLQTF